MVVAWVAITDCITSLPSASSTATEMVLWWTSRPIYLMLSIGCSFREVGYCSAQQPNPTAKGAPFYNACPILALPPYLGHANLKLFRRSGKRLAGPPGVAGVELFRGALGILVHFIAEFA